MMAFHACLLSLNMASITAIFTLRQGLPNPRMCHRFIMGVFEMESETERQDNIYHANWDADD